MFDGENTIGWHKKEAEESSLASGAVRSGSHSNIRRNKRRNIQVKGATEKAQRVTTRYTGKYL